MSDGKHVSTNRSTDTINPFLIVIFNNDYFFMHDEILQSSLIVLVPLPLNQDIKYKCSELLAQLKHRQKPLRFILINDKIFGEDS